MPESEDYLNQPKRHFDEAVRTNGHELFRVAARSAYSASLNAARAIIFEITQTAPKTHSGVGNKFRELMFKGSLGRVDMTLADALSNDFEVKQSVDYGDGAMVGADAGPQIAHAKALIELAESIIQNQKKK